MTWSVEFDDRARRELRQLDRQIQRDILRFFRERIAIDDDPRRIGKALRGELSGLWRYRLRDYRMVCKIEDDKLIVLVISLGHRKQVYR